ncbi:MAG: transcription elongation factor GreA [Gammaproteobacteria bacterium CG11_big_fil_rev_8_21_14_0_20_46_22]|nr:MAG: transcription elongation factor GreA [Gammaproteobacteria bacterium CG12_big_fil_rev_8_21_14_0_65_46_12]PIR11079.1 MAG: transcription elongation factor GreA [Gammaproteobacteria bacterium CG11_big_fil_rev_8_21_14_0_20_46_22]
MEKFPMTVDGHKALEIELKQLKSVERPKVVAAIAEARAHGDLKENAEYHAARERQGFLEGRIADIEAKLSRAQVIDISTLPKVGKVVFGVTVEIMDCNTEVTKVYQIVGEDEADIEKAKVSYKAPIARALIGKEKGDVVEFKAPGGVIEYEIVSVSYLL